jgi:uncharacterized protein (TIGR03435 family)
MYTRARRLRLSTIVVVTAVVFSHAIAAQDAAFEVASIHPNTSDASQQLRALPTGRLIATNVPLRRLIVRAYKLHDTQVVGAPDWIASERFDIDARTATAPADGLGAVMPLLQPLLADRFKLRAHMDTRELPAYVLVAAQRDRQPGAQIRPTTADCSHATTLTQDEIRANARDGWPPCGMVFTVGFVSTPAGGGEQLLQTRIRRSGTTMAGFAAGLQEGLDRPVIDATGLEGRFDVEYTYSPQPRRDTDDSPFGAPPPTLFVALEEQLGLKLESRRTAVPVLVIDSIERPTAN